MWMTGSKSEIRFFELPEDDPKVRRPDLALARRELDFLPKYDLETGLEQTIKYFATKINPQNLTV